MNEDWRYAGIRIKDSRTLLIIIIAASFIIPAYIYVTESYITTEVSIVRTASEVELMDGKYIMSQEYVMNVSSDEHRADVGDEYLAFDYSYWGEFENEYQLCAYSFESGEVEVVVDDMATDCEYVSTDGEYIAYVYEDVGWVLSWYPEESIAGLIDVPCASVNNEIIAYEYTTMARPTENYVAIYFLDNDTSLPLWVGAEFDRIYYTPDIYDNLVVCVNDSWGVETYINFIDWYNIDTGEYGNMTRYEASANRHIYWSSPKIWDEIITLTYYYYDNRFPPDEYSELNYINMDESTEPLVLKDRYAHDDYWNTDISQDFVIYEAFDEDFGTWSVYATDVTDTDVDFNISVVDGEDSIFPSVYIGNDGYGHMAYTRYNSTNENWDLVMRYINDTTLMVEPTEPDDNDDIIIETQEIYDYDKIYIAMISTCVGLATGSIYYNFREEWM